MSTNKISTLASLLFFNPNWMGVKARLKIKLRTNGSAIIRGALPCAIVVRTEKYETAIMPYSIVQTGPNSHRGDAQEGFFSFSYQAYVVFFIIVIQPTTCPENRYCAKHTTS